MKKTLISLISCFCLVVCLCAFVPGCTNKKLEGEYRVSTLSCMGLSASQKSFSQYSDSRSDADKQYNALYKPLYLLMNLKLTLKGGKATLVMKDFEALLEGEGRYAKALESARTQGYVYGSDLIIDNLKYIKDTTQKDAYYIYPVDDNGKQTSLSEIWDDTLFSAPFIHARIANGKLACQIKICVYESQEEKSGAAFITNVTINMKH